jgi:hypothetical protein
MPISEGIVQGEFPAADPIHIITAWNPGCEPHSQQENLRFSEDLADWVDARNLPLWEGTGFASDGGWREEGWSGRLFRAG